MYFKAINNVVLVWLCLIRDALSTRLLRDLKGGLAGVSCVVARNVSLELWLGIGLST